MIKGGPRVVTDGLVLCLDAHDAKSYAGEPTSNLIPNVANPNLSTSGWYSTGWNGNISTDTDEGALVLNATNGWRSMSYDFGVTNGTVTVQFDYKLKSAEHTNIFMVVLNGTHLGSYTQLLDTYIYPSITEYKTYKKTFTTTTDSKICIVLRGTDRAGLTDEMFVKNLQVESKSYSTPFVNGSRSATNGWVDRSGNGNSGTLTNMIGTEVTHYRDGQVIMPVANSYLEFDGSNDYVVVTNGMNSLVGTSATTFAAWIYIDTVTSSWDGIIANKVNATEGIALLVSNTQKIFFQYDSTSGNYAIDGGSNIPTAEWTYVVATYDTSYGYKTYMNGSLNAQETDTGKSIASSGDMTFNIGAQRSSSGNPAAYFPGKIARVEVYNKALTAAEVLQNYNATKGRFS